MLKKFRNQSKGKEEKYVTIKSGDKKAENGENFINDNFQKNSLDEKFWFKCEKCGKNIFRKDFEENLYVCPECGKHYRLKARKRIDLLMDRGSFIEINKYCDLKDPINFPEYKEKAEKYRYSSKEQESVITGVGRINGLRSVICSMNPEFMMGSMGSVTGDKITYAMEYAADHDLPIIICTASGGARMQEGLVSLMQMAKTSQAVTKLSEKGLPYIAVLTDPTTGGVTASFAMLGDIIISEPETLIGFAGKRVIEQTIKKELPEGFQSAEFMLEHGFLDMIVERKNMKDTLHKILSMHRRG